MCQADKQLFQGAPAVVGGGSAVGVGQAQGDQGGLCDLVSQLAAKTFNVKNLLSF